MCVAIHPRRPQDHLDEPGACFARTAAGVTVALPQGEAATEWRHEEASEAEAPGEGSAPSATESLHLTFTEWREIPLKEAGGKSSGRLAVAAKGLVRGGGGALVAGRCGAPSSPRSALNPLALHTRCTLRTRCTVRTRCPLRTRCAPSAHLLHSLYPLRPLCTLCTLLCTFCALCTLGALTCLLLRRYALCADFVVRPAIDNAAAAAGAQAVELRGGFARVAATESETLRYKTLMKSLLGTAVKPRPRPAWPWLTVTLTLGLESPTPSPLFHPTASTT